MLPPGRAAPGHPSVAGERGQGGQGQPLARAARSRGVPAHGPTTPVGELLSRRQKTRAIFRRRTDFGWEVREAEGQE